MNTFRSISIGLLVLFALASQPSFAESPIVLQSGGKEGDPVCRLIGKIRPLVPSSSGKGFRGLQNKIKIRFDAKDPQKCQKMIYVYCRENIIRRRDVPDGLTGYFVPGYDPKKEKPKLDKTGAPIPSHKYEISETCQIVVE